MKEKRKQIATNLFMLISFITVAQGPPPPQPPPPVGLPIDSGLIILVAIGLLYGAFKVLRIKKV